MIPNDFWLVLQKQETIENKMKGKLCFGNQTNVVYRVGYLKISVSRNV